MYLTKQEVLDLKADIIKDLDDFYYKGKKHIYVIQGEERIILLYAVDLLNKILIMLHNDNYIKEELFESMQNQDWIKYSFSSKSIWQEKRLKERLQIRPSKNVQITDMLWKQAEYLEHASDYIISMLEDI